MKRTLPFIAILCVLVVQVGCQQSGRRYYDSHAPLLSASKEQLYQHFDEDVIITGKAEALPNEGVVVVMDDGTRVMIPELHGWPKRAARKRVTVMGMLQRVPTAVTASGGDTPKPDDRFLLKGVRWKVGRATTQPAQ